MLRTFGLFTLLLALASASAGQGRSIECDDTWGDDPSYCEVRQETLAAGNPIDVDASPNGGVRVIGWDRPDAVLHARIVAYGSSEQEAREVAAQVTIDTGGNQVRARGPQRDGERRWSVSYELQVPQGSQLTLNTVNGGISVRDLRGSVRLRARNGGIKLEDVGGEIRGETTNGGVDVTLRGDRWEGSGLNVETSNGGIKLSLPANYSAELETGTTNGRINIDFPVTVQGRIGKHIQTTLGAGGPKIRVMTYNGGVSVRRR